jgi:hypothetical protein
MRLLYDEAINEIIEGIDPEFIQHAKEYFTWICEQVDGTNVLDVGSYRGVVSLMLSKLGKKVKLVVTDQLDKQYIDNHWNGTILRNIEVEFYDPKIEGFAKTSEAFDSIILSERGYNIPDVLENIIENEKIRPDGRLIISQPFGLFGTDSAERQKTYGVGLLSLLSRGFSMKNVELLGGQVDYRPHYWMCYSFDRTGERCEIDPSLIYFIERNELLFEKKDEAFNDIVRDLEEKIETLRGKHEQLDNDISIEIKTAILALEKVGTIVDTNFPKIPIDILPDKTSIASEIQPIDEKEIENSIKEVRSSQEATIIESNETLKRKIDIALMKLNESIIILNKELIEEERLLNNYNQLKIKYDKLESKYDSLSSSKSVKMTLALWNLFKRKPVIK